MKFEKTKLRIQKLEIQNLKNEKGEIKMSLKQKVSADLIQAMKDKNTLAKGVLQIVKSGFNNAEKVAGKELDNEQLIPVIQKEIKQTNQALEGAIKAKRQDLITQEETKLALLKSYLPEQLDEIQITLRLQNYGVASGMSMGEAMKLTKTAFKTGETDPRLVSQIVKELIK